MPCIIEGISTHIKKMKALFAGELKDRILIHFNNPSKTSVIRHFPDAGKMFEAEIENANERMRFVDDFVPATNLGYGNAYSGYVGGELNSDENNMWSLPIPDVYDKLAGIRYDEKYHWLNEHIRGMEFFKNHMPDNILLSCPATHGPDDMAETLRGQEIFYDLYDRPEDVKRLLRLCADFVLQFRARLLGIADKFEGGHICWQEFWTPDTCLALTADTATNYPNETFETFMVPEIKYMVKRTGGTFWMHLEGAAFHIAEGLKKIGGLSLLQYTNNPKWPRGIAMMETLRSKFGQLPLKLLVTRQELLDGMRQKTLTGNCIYDVGHDTENLDDYVRTPEEAEEIMRLAGEYRASF